MRESLIDWLVCPRCNSVLRLERECRADDGQILEGRLICRGCGAGYPIRDGVADLRPSDRRGDELELLQARTTEKFGFEWQHFKDWGWLEDFPDVANAQETFYGARLEDSFRAFRSKTLFEESGTAGGLAILDAGCGNGRYSYQAALHGAQVIGVDLGPAVVQAFEHTRHLANVHIVRADLLRLPFPKYTFDRAFSIGVLQHTGNGTEAFSSLAEMIKPSGQLAVCVYGKGRLSYEILDSLLRVVTTKMPVEWLLKSSRLAASLARWLKSGRFRPVIYRQLYSFVNLLPTEHHMFDWWSAPVAHHYEPKEVLSWFYLAGFKILRTSPANLDAPDYDDRRRRLQHASIVAMGQRRSD